MDMNEIIAKQIAAQKRPKASLKRRTQRRYQNTLDQRIEKNQIRPGVLSIFIGVQIMTLGFLFIFVFGVSPIAAYVTGGIFIFVSCMMVFAYPSILLYKAIQWRKMSEPVFAEDNYFNSSIGALVHKR